MAEVNIPSSNEDPNYRYKMPRPLLRVEGKGNGIRTNITNMRAISDALKRAPDYCTKFCGCELGAQSKYKDTDGYAIVNGKHEPDQIAMVIDRFIEKFVLCENCQYPEVDLYVKNKTLKGHCNACGSETTFDGTHKVSTYIIKSQSLKDKDMSTVKKASKKLDTTAQKTKEKNQLDAEKVEEYVDERDLADLLSQAKSSLASTSKSSKDIEELITTMKLSHGLTDVESCYLALELSFDGLSISLANFKSRISLIRKFASPLKTRDFLDQFETLVFSREDKEISYSRLLLYIYEESVVDEIGILSFYKGPKQQKRLKESSTFEKALKEATSFLDWLEVGSDDEEEEEEEEEAESDDFFKTTCQVAQKHDLSVGTQVKDVKATDLGVGPEASQPEQTQSPRETDEVPTEEEEDMDIDAI